MFSMPIQNVLRCLRNKFFVCWVVLIFIMPSKYFIIMEDIEEMKMSMMLVFMHFMSQDYRNSVWQTTHC